MNSSLTIYSLDTLLRETEVTFVKTFCHEPAFTAYAPGRINIIGEHTDYNFGLSVPAAINRWICISIAPTSKKDINIISVQFEDDFQMETDENFIPNASWQKYVYGCIDLFRKKFNLSTGFNALIHGNVPLGSGVSSSAALTVAMMNALRKLYHANDWTDTALILECQQVEHLYMHVKCGLLDQYASQFSKAGNFMVLDFQNMSHEYVPASLPDYCWVLSDTAVKRELASAKYSERVMETQKALEFIRKQDTSVTHFRDITKEHLNLIQDIILKKRLQHYLSENKRVTLLVDSLKNNKPEYLGNLLNASHLSLKDDYEVSCDELDLLAKTAKESEACEGSRMMGGGFGGCTISLVKKDQVERFCEYLRIIYQNTFRKEPAFSVYELTDGAGIYSSTKGEYVPNYF